MAIREIKGGVFSIGAIDWDKRTKYFFLVISSGRT